MSTPERDYGRELCFGTMARGGGSNDAQAILLINLDDNQFDATLKFIETTLSDAERIKGVIKDINTTHAKINVLKEKTAPFVVPYMFLNDMNLTLRNAIDSLGSRPQRAVREPKLWDLVERCVDAKQLDGIK